MRRFLHRFGLHHWRYYIVEGRWRFYRRECWFCPKDELLR